MSCDDWAIGHTYINQCIPISPEVTIGNDTDGIAKLRLYVGRHSDHETNNLPLYREHLLIGQLMLSFQVLQYRLIGGGSTRTLW